MVSANPTGPIVVSAGRNGAYGDCVARLLEFAGHTVEREYYYNDAGTQMDRFRESVEALRRGEPVPEDGYHGDYVAELAARDGRPRRRHAEADRGDDGAVPHPLRLVGPPERARAAARAASAEARTYEKDGATWARSSAYGDDEDRVLLRSAEQGGRPTYRAADVAYLVDKLERGFDRALYVLGADHHGTSKWYAAIARMLGYDPERVEVLLYQLVHLTRSGETTKMSKRRGDVVFLDEFIDDVGVDAARWYLVNRGPDRAIEIDVDMAAESAERNPVYYVRTRTRGSPESSGTPATRRSEALRRGRSRQEERDVVKRLADFPASCARRPSTARPRRSPSTRSGWPTPTTASTTSAASSARSRRRSASASVARRST